MLINSRIIAALAILAFLVLPSVGLADDYKAVRNALAGVKVDSIRYVEGLDMYEVITNNTHAAYMTKDMRYFIAGRAFDLHTKRDLTAESIDRSRRVEFSSLNLKNAIKMGTGKTSIAVFTDPNCGYCQKLHEELSKIKDFTVHIYLYPLAASNGEAKARSAAIWCADNRLSALNAVFGKKPFKSAGKPSEVCMNVIEENIRFGRDRGINSTPTIVLEDGRIVTGYKDAAELSALIKK